MEIRIEKKEGFSVCGRTYNAGFDDVSNDIERLSETYGKERLYFVIRNTERGNFDRFIGVMQTSDSLKGENAETETLDIPSGLFAAVKIQCGINETEELLIRLKKELSENGLMPDETVGVSLIVYDGNRCLELLTPVVSAKPLSEKLKAVSELEGINIGPALKRLNGMQKVLETASKSTGASLSERSGKMIEALENGSIDSFITVVHGLKSSLAAIGADNLSKIAADIEAAGKRGDTAFCAENAPSFALDIIALGDKLNGIFSDFFL